MSLIERIVSIVTYLAESQSYHGVTEIGKELRINKSSVNRILSTLESLKWVVQDHETRKYRLGSRILEIGVSLMSHLNIRIVSMPYLYQLRDLINETAMLSLRVEFERIFIEQVQDNHEIRMVAELGKRYPLWCGAQGKVILANMEESEIGEVINNLIKSGISVLASGQRVDVNILLKELGEIRKQGFALSVGERVIEATAVAGPIFDSDNRIAGAISVGGPLQRFTVDMAKQYGPFISQIAMKINLQLGAFSGTVTKNK